MRLLLVLLSTRRGRRRCLLPARNHGLRRHYRLLPATLLSLLALTLLDLRRESLQLPDFQGQQDGIVALQPRHARDAASETVLVRLLLALICRGAWPDRFGKPQGTIRARPIRGTRSAAAVHGIKNRLLLLRREVLEDLDLVGARHLGHRVLKPEAGRTQAQAAHASQEKMRLEKLDLTIGFA
jgi:hypothetical protein